MMPTPTDLTDVVARRHVNYRVNRIASLRDLSAGWHDGAGAAITDEAAAGALSISAQLAASPAHVEHWAVMPHEDGGIWIEQSQPGPVAHVMVMEIGPTGAVDVHGLVLRHDDDSKAFDNLDGLDAAVAVETVLAMRARLTESVDAASVPSSAAGRES